MAVTKSKTTMASHSALQALTAAALILPGLVQTPAQAAGDDEFSFQYGRYQEGERDLGGLQSPYKPIMVDSLHAGSNVKLMDRVGFAFNYIQDSWSGATPISTAPAGLWGNRPDATVGASPFIQSFNENLYFDAQKNPLSVARDANGLEQTLFDETDFIDKVIVLGKDAAVHTLSNASPETRKEGNFKLSYDWDEAAVNVGGGISNEPDYESRNGNIGLRLDFNQKQTTLDMGASYTNSDTFARLSQHFTGAFINSSGYQTKPIAGSGDGLLGGRREDWAFNLNLTQTVNKDALFKLGGAYTRTSGFLENPYKGVTAIYLVPVIDVGGGEWAAIGTVHGIPDVKIGSSVDPSKVSYVGQADTFIEQRPDLRNQWHVSTGWVQYVQPFEAALHFDYKFFHDDWGINAHTFESDWVQPLGAGWTITPRVRYYSQSAADFYYRYLLVDQAKPGDPRSNYNALPTKDFSSDHRLSAYGALSGGIMLSKQFAKGIRLDAGFEYYTHKGSWKLGGGGEDAYADFDYYVANATLNVNLTQLGRSITEGGHDHHHHHHHASHGAPLPAGVMFGHVMDNPGDFMVGYRYMYGRQDGAMLHGETPVGDAAIVAGGCSALGVTCRTSPTYMNMHMHMLDIMYAATDWLTLMVMPQFMDMDMDMRLLGGVTPAAGVQTDRDHLHGGHKTGGIGDTGMYGLFKLFGENGHHVNLALGVTAPTGSVDEHLSSMHSNDFGYIHYGMQLGSGTWDFKPSLTYTGQIGDWFWGGQVSGTKRLESRGETGFAFGDVFQSTAWSGYQVFDWLSATARGLYTTQGSIRNRYNPLPGRDNGAYGSATGFVSDTNPTEAPMDNPQNYGGHFWDVGLGLSASVIDGKFAGHNFSVEWLQPVMDNVNGYQLERSGTLNATWTYMF